MMRKPKPAVAGMGNDADELIFYIEDTSSIKPYDGGRQCVAYLRKNR